MAQRISRVKKTIVIAAAIALSIGGAGAAFAYWTSTGTGTGTGTTANANVFNIASTPGSNLELVPGGDGQTVAFTVTNPGPATQILTSVLVDFANPWVPDDLDCETDDYQVTITTDPLYAPIVAGGTLTGEATIVLAESGVNQDACQGEAVPLVFSAS